MDTAGRRGYTLAENVLILHNHWKRGEKQALKRRELMLVVLSESLCKAVVACLNSSSIISFVSGLGDFEKQGIFLCLVWKR